MPAPQYQDGELNQVLSIVRDIFLQMHVPHLCKLSEFLRPKLILKTN